jgi:streptogramin lyase
VQLFELPRTSPSGAGSYPDASPYSLVSGPDGRLWFDDEVNKSVGIARISTQGKLGPTILAGYDRDLTIGPNAQVWFSRALGTFDPTLPQLALATRAGIVVTEDLPAQDFPAYESGIAGMTLGPDGNLWLTNGVSSIVRVSGLETPLGGLDYRQRPRRAPDYAYDSSTENDQWTNVTSSAHPTFAGVAKPGAKVTLWAQQQGENQPVAIGQVKASSGDGSWTLKSHKNLSDGIYAVTATQAGNTGPASVLYSLAPDASGDMSDALVIQTRRARKPHA